MPDEIANPVPFSPARSMPLEAAMYDETIADGSVSEIHRYFFEWADRFLVLRRRSA